MPKLWQLVQPADQPPAEALLALVDQQPIVAELLTRRGYADPLRAHGFIDPDFYTPAPPDALPGVAQAAHLLVDAIQSRQVILIWGDFDVDGQTASALLRDALQGLYDEAERGRIVLHIPDRARDSHGVQRAVLAELIATKSPALLITCDTGIDAHDAIDYANAHGLTTIITDHHNLPDHLPDADAIIEPKLLPPDHALYALPGVGVAFKLIEQVYTLFGRAADTAQFLDLVALGIVADVAAQTNDTRYLLQIGLERLRRTERPGLRALLEVARLDPLKVGAEQIGFQLGPRLNSAGRLGDPQLSVELLTTRDTRRVPILAQQLEGLNMQRRTLQREIETAARRLISDDPTLLDYAALVLYQADWHAGVLGPVAGRLAEEYGRPVVLLTSSDERIARGSARSVAGRDIFTALNALSSLLISFGGHPGAAGLALPISDISALRRNLSGQLTSQGTTNSITFSPGEALQIDALLPLEKADTPLVSALMRLAPFGEGNPAVTFESDDLEIVSAAYIDRLHLHRLLTVQDMTGVRRSVYWWNSPVGELPLERIDLAYTLGLTPDRGVEMTLVDYRIHDLLNAVPLIGRRVRDLRAEPDPMAALAQLKKTLPDLIIWAEGIAKAESPGVPRESLIAGVPLAIYTIPPSRAILAETLAQLDPPGVYIFGVDPPLQTEREFLRQLEGITKFVINQQAGQISLQTLCGRIAQSEAAIRCGLAAIPKLRVLEYPNGALDLAFSIAPAEDSPHQTVQALTRLRILLDEARAYRDYFRRAPIDALLH